MQKLFVHGLVVVSLLAGAAAVADALVVTDRERLDAFADALSGTIDTDLIDGAMGYFDVEREPVLVTTPDGDEEFVAGDGAALASTARDALRAYHGRSIEEVQRSVELHDDEARVAVRLRTPEGMVNATFDLAKHGERWFVHRIRLS